MSDITTEPETASAATAPFYPPRNSGRGGARPGAGRRKGSAAWLERQRDPEAYDNEWRVRRGLPPKSVQPKPATEVEQTQKPAAPWPPKPHRGARPGAGRRKKPATVATPATELDAAAASRRAQAAAHREADEFGWWIALTAG